MTPSRKLLTTELKAKIEARIRECFDKAKVLYPEFAEKFDEMPTIRYNIKNRVGGMAITGGVDDWTIRLNLILCYENEDDFVFQTVGHEAAHLIQRAVYGSITPEGKKVRSHGKEWKSVMVALGMKPATYHKYDTSSIDTGKKRRAKNGAVVTASGLADMIKRLQNGYKRLPDAGKEQFADWIEKIQSMMDEPGESE
jgi:predicted SprT family Zn-dependent metalloprotease